jgi:predicted dehydrogenase
MEPISITLEELKLPNVIPLPVRNNRGIGMIGFGEFAQRAHAPDYQALGWPIVAAAVRNPESQRIAKEQFGIDRVYSDYREVINDPAVELINLVTQPTLREEVVFAAAEAGKPIIVEKPLGLTTDACRRMVEAAEHAKIPLAVHQNYRWMRGNFLAYHVVKGGWLGEPFFVGIEKFGNQDSDFAQRAVYANCDDYLTLHWNTHLADLLRYWTGRDALRVAAHTARMNGQNFKSDNLFVSLHDYGPGLTGHIVHSELLRSSLGGNRCRIDGDRGSLVFDFSGDQMLLESHKLGSRVHRLRTSDTEWKEALCGSMGDFLLALEEEREPSVSGRRNLATVNTVIAEMESVKAGGKWIDVSR